MMGIFYQVQDDLRHTKCVLQDKFSKKDLLLKLKIIFYINKKKSELVVGTYIIATVNNNGYFC